MPTDLQSLLDKLYLWQLTFLLSLSGFSMYFTGDSLFAGGISDGEEKEIMALLCGFALLAITVLLKYIPPPQRRGDNKRPKIAISPTQMALVAQLEELTPFTEAAQTKTSDYDLDKTKLLLKVTELRLELATLQGLLIRKVDDSGRHMVQYRYVDDKTTFR